MKILRYQIPIIGIFCIVIATFAKAETANLNGKSYSLSIHDTSTIVQGYLYQILFTTYDNNQFSLPYYYDSSTGTIHYSRELKKVGSQYKADYYALVSGMIDDYGEISLSLGNIDFNNNGIDDICEINRSVNIQVSGTWSSHDGDSGGISGSLTKNAGSRQGLYNLTIYDTWAGTIGFSGIFYAGTVAGSIAYSQKNKTISVVSKSTWDTVTSPTTINTTYEILDEDTIRVNANDRLTTTIFHRNGSTYSAIVDMVDGGLDTFWPDYTKWNIKIVDNNDSDKDGIPNLSDASNDINNTFLPFLPLLLE